MIYTKSKSISSIYIKGRAILTVYYKGKIVWTKKKSEEIIDDEILSCYYNGYWIDDYPWTDDTPWKD